VATVIAGFSETVGISLLLPVLNIFQNPELAVIYSEKLESFLGIEVNLTDVTRFIFAGLIAFFLISGGFQLVTDILIARLIEGLKAIWQKRILNIYLSEDYAFHINSMKGQLIQKQMVHTDRAGEVVLQFCNLARDVFLAIFISLMLMILSWSSMVVLILTAGPLLYLTSIYSRKIINRKAEEAQNYEAKAFSLASEAMDGIKEIWAFGMQSSMSKRFSLLINGRRIRQTFIRSVFNVPSIFLKTTTLVALALVLYIFVVAERADLIGLLGVFGIGLFRVNGAVGRINNAIVSISGAWPSLRIVSEELNRSSHASARLERELMFKEKISFNDVSFSFKNERLFGIKNISLTIKRGSIVGIVGPSGSGKTTLLGLLLGFLDPGGGEVFIDDKNLQLYSTSGWLKRIGYVGQQSFVMSGTLSENISFTTNKMIDLEQMETAQQLTDFSSFTETLPGGLGTVIGEGGLDLSGGQRQRLAIARAVYRNPDMYVFDEATSNLDHYSENKILSQIKASCRKDQKTLVMVAHKLSLVSDADTIFVMEDGCLRESGSHQELMSLDNGSYRNLYERAILEVQKT
jgi:ABC-type multidrug transport system fused ATPase/permease subunit